MTAGICYSRTHATATLLSIETLAVNQVLSRDSIPPNLTPSEKLRRLTNTFNKNISRGFGRGSQ